MVDIASLMGQSLDPTSYQSFGAAVNDFQNSGLSDALMAQQSTSNSGSSQADYSSSTRSYAQDLIKYAPKFEFLFKVDFIFNPEYVKKLNGGKSQNAFSFVILTIDRPKFSFEWEEVNYYNYRTKFLKSIRHEPLNLTFYDDIENHVLDFCNAVRKAFSPIARNTFATGLHFDDARKHGFSFSNPNTEYQNDTAMRGVLNGSSRNVLEKMIIRQVFAHGSKMVEFTFLNPRITSFGMDGLSHLSGDGQKIDMSIDYDSVHISEVLKPTGTPSPSWGKDMLGSTASSTAQTIPNANTMETIASNPLTNPAASMVNGTSNLANQLSSLGLSGDASSLTKKFITGGGMLGSLTSSPASLSDVFQSAPDVQDIVDNNVVTVDLTTDNDSFW